MQFSRAIRVARAARNYSQRELAERASLDPSYVSLLEKGARNPSLDAINSLARALAVPPHLLMLLASDRENLIGVAEEEAAELGMRLLDLLLSAGDETRA